MRSEPQTRARLRAFLVAISVLLSAVVGAQAGGTVTGCSETALRSALAGGGVVTFASDCSITLADPLTIESGTTTIDAQGHAVTLSGGGSVRLFEINGNLNLFGLTLANGVSSNGGALMVYSGTVLASNCTFIGNSATGTNGVNGAAGDNSSILSGGRGGDGTPGTPGLGGAIYNLDNVTLLRCLVVSNTATGGNGGAGGNGGNGVYNGGSGGDGGSGGTAAGGAIYNLGYLQVSNCTFSANQAFAGSGGAGGSAGTGSVNGAAGHGAPGGNGYGGAIHSGWQSIWIWSSTFNDNAAEGGASVGGGGSLTGNGQNGPAGGVGAGGAICNAATGAITNCTFYSNTATGASGGNGGGGTWRAGDGGDGGDGRGGGLYNASSTVAVNCTFSGGSAIGGTNGTPGSGKYGGRTGSPGLNLGGNTDNGAGSFTIINCALGAATSGGCGAGTITDGGYNISADTTLVLSGTSSAGTDPGLVSAANNGGPTKTMALRTTSACLNRIPAAQAPQVDQRGVPRPLNNLSDIGAYEYELNSVPVITLQPADQVVAPGASATFTVAAVGATPLSYQWRLGGVPIGGATATSYTVNATPTNEGPYTVSVSNSLSWLVSGPAFARLRATIVTAPTNQLVLPGATAVFTVVATGDSPLSYQWQRDGIDIAGGTRSVYTISNALPDSTGTYAVKVWNPYGSNSASAALGILPAITTQPVDQSLPAGSPAVFSVAAIGSTPLGYQWRLNGVPIPGATLTSYALDAVQATNAGRYDAVATNRFGSTNSYAALLKVLYSISGAVREGASGLAGVTVPIDSTQTATTDANGNFTAMVSAGSYTLVPVKASYAFQPTSVTVSIPPSTNVSYAAMRLYAISGKVTGVGSNAPVRVSVVGAGTNVTVLASGGQYAIPGLFPGSYTVFPSVYCYAFTNRQVVLTAADAAGVDFTAAPDIYVVSGRVTAGGQGVAGVTLAAGSVSTQTDPFGHYTLTGLCPTNYIVTPAFPCHSFNPANRSVTVGPSIGDVNFETFTNGLFAIRGRVTTNGVGLPNVVISAGERTGLTDSSGYYTLGYLCPGNYTVVASLDGFNFSPASAGATIVSTDVTANFTAVPSFRISGLVTVQGTTSALNETVAVKAAGTATNMVVTTTNGSYAFVGLPAGTYTVTPVLDCYLFTPASQSVGLSSSNPAPSADFSALHDIHSISGTIMVGQLPLAGAVVVALGASGFVTSPTDAAGHYSFTNLCSGAYTLAPTQACTVFYPPTRSAIVGAGLPDVDLVDFAATRNVFILRGRVNEIETGRGLSGVTITAGSKTVTSTNGDFTIADVCAGVTEIEPGLAGYLFDPPVLSTNLSADLNPVFTGVPLQLSVTLTNASASLSFGAPPGITSDLMTSSNLVHWDEAFTTNNALTKVVWVKFLDAGAGNYPQRFYRVTEVPYLTVSHDASGTNLVSYGAPPAMVYRIEASPDFVHWESVYTNSSSPGPMLFQFPDPAWTNVPIRFYRATP